MIRYYVRVSSVEQKTDRQLVAYKDADSIYIDKMSGASKERPNLKKMLEDLKENDIVVVKSLDRLSRSTKDLLEIVSEIEKKKAVLKVLDRNIDTGDAIGKFFITVLGAVAELELSNIKQRRTEGIAVAKDKGVYKGRQVGSIELKGERLEKFKKLYKLGMNKSDLSKEFEVPRSTIYRWIKVLQDRNEIL